MSVDSGLSVDVSELKRLASLFKNPKIEKDINAIIKEDGFAALIGQAIADNFAKEGPGWAPLKGATIRRSLSKAKKAELKKKGMTNAQIEAHEKQARLAEKADPSKRNQALRQILKRTGMLINSVTIPKSASNVYEVDTTGVIWGTSLHYARIHNQGGTIKYPGTEKGFGKGIKIPAHNITIPKREFLVIRPEWQKELDEYVVTRVLQILSGIKTEADR